jgi:hypothetical protein
VHSGSKKLQTREGDENPPERTATTKVASQVMAIRPLPI